jgi:hypothetical protein
MVNITQNLNEIERWRTVVDNTYCLKMNVQILNKHCYCLHIN